ncbi:uncharacterized protein OCT59_021533 [Rhizophagus irregularis]|uniref:uncharacterized protein n=1 Tax=Rhizophagus irregularis TaxID=588596 RepID=UPI00331AD012|nr:hypothetical protein OCT59_021533 [Rhizophagus irregularis]
MCLIFTIMELNCKSFINLPKNIEEVVMPFFTESFESLDVENAKVAKSSEIAKSAKIVISELEDIIMSPKS